MARFVWKNGDFRDGEGKPMDVPVRDCLCAPHVISDIPDYASPIDGRLITSRTHRREDLKRHNCVEYEPSLSPAKGKGLLKNERFCKKHGLSVAEEHRT